MTQPTIAHENLAAALAAVQGELTVIAKTELAKVPTKTGGSYSYTYANLAGVSGAVLPLLSRHGLAFITMPTLNEKDRLVLAWELVHESGENRTGVYPLVGVTPQEIGSAITYARRYILSSVTGAATDDDDGEQATRYVQQQSRPPRAEEATLTERPKPAATPPPAQKSLTEAIDVPATLVILGGEDIPRAARLYVKLAEEGRLDQTGGQILRMHFVGNLCGAVEDMLAGDVVLDAETLAVIEKAGDWTKVMSIPFGDSQRTLDDRLATAIGRLAVDDAADAPS